MKLLQGLPSASLGDRAYLPDSAGVYLAATADQLLYIGQSTNIRQRWQSHEKLDRLMSFSGVRLYYLLVPQGFCGQLESALIRQFSPILNIRDGVTPLTSSAQRSLDVSNKQIRNRWGQAKTEGFYQRITTEGLEALKASAAAAEMTVADYLEWLFRQRILPPADYRYPSDVKSRASP